VLHLMAPQGTLSWPRDFYVIAIRLHLMAPQGTLSWIWGQPDVPAIVFASAPNYVAEDGMGL